MTAVHSPTSPRDGTRPRVAWPRLWRLEPRLWVKAVVIGMAAGLVIAIPTRVVPNDFFARMIPTRPQDYAFLVVSSLLLGLNLAVVPFGSIAGRLSAGGLGTAFAVGCPICNKFVVALIGVSGALSWFAPLQPVLALASIALLTVTLRRSLLSDSTSCPV